VGAGQVRHEGSETLEPDEEHMALEGFWRILKVWYPHPLQRHAHQLTNMVHWTHATAAIRQVSNKFVNLTNIGLHIHVWSKFHFQENSSFTDQNHDDTNGAFSDFCCEFDLINADNNLQAPVRMLFASVGGKGH
jgi:hypothetical protein